MYYVDFSELTKTEQMALFNTLKQDLFPDESDKITKLLKSIREANLLLVWVVFIVEAHQ